MRWDFERSGSFDFDKATARGKAGCILALMLVTAALTLIAFALLDAIVRWFR